MSTAKRQHHPFKRRFGAVGEFEPERPFVPQLPSEDVGGPMAGAARHDQYNETLERWDEQAREAGRARQREFRHEAGAGAGTPGQPLPQPQRPFGEQFATNQNVRDAIEGVIPAIQTYIDDALVDGMTAMKLQIDRELDAHLGPIFARLQRDIEGAAKRTNVKRQVRVVAVKKASGKKATSRRLFL